MRTLTQLGEFLAHVVTVTASAGDVVEPVCSLLRLPPPPSATTWRHGGLPAGRDDFGTSGIDCSAVLVDGEVFGSIGPTAMLVLGFYSLI